MANTELSNKLSSLTRYAGTAGATTLTILGALSFLDAQQIAEIKAQVDILNQSVVTAYGALTKMWLILGPVAIGVAAKLGWNSSGVQALAAKLLGIAKNDADPKAQEAKEALVTAAASREIGTQAIINPTLAPSPATPPNVVVSAAAATATTVVNPAPAPVV